MLYTWGMWIQDVLEQLDLSRTELAALLGISRQALQHWVTNDGGLIPRDRACYLEVLTRGAIKVDLSEYD